LCYCSPFWLWPPYVCSFKTLDIWSRMTLCECQTYFRPDPQPWFAFIETWKQIRIYWGLSPNNSSINQPSNFALHDFHCNKVNALHTNQLIRRRICDRFGNENSCRIHGKNSHSMWQRQPEERNVWDHLTEGNFMTNGHPENNPENTDVDDIENFVERSNHRSQMSRWSSADHVLACLTYSRSLEIIETHLVTNQGTLWWMSLDF
jgi:hypothetical protein